ncbi:MAG TPA: methyltransferase domain-containing protein [Patescibacteria group bacterium]|nr:methyltransferase domain-containing protein [Patescibacteria group bacterium]
MKEDLITESWAKISADWKKTVTPPMCPSPDDIKIYKRWVNKVLSERKGKINVLVLGSTREIRDFLNKSERISVTVCDINKSHYLAMNRLIKNKRKDEIFIKHEWSLAPLKENFFDIIIGDGIISNVAKKNKTRFLQNMARAIKNNGLVIIRELYVYNNRRIKIDEVLSSFSRFRIDKWSPMELLISLEMSVMDKSTGKISMPKILNHLKKKYLDKKSGNFLFPGGKNTDIILNHPNFLKWISINKEWDSHDFNSVRKFIQNYFHVVKMEHGLDHKSKPTCQMFGDIMPIWVLAPKKN